MADPKPRNWLGRAVDAAANTETNPLVLAWRMLPPEARRAYSSVPAAVAELTPGAAVRDAVDASGETMNALMQGRGWDAAGGVATMLAAAAGVVPGTRLAGKGATALNVANKAVVEAVPSSALITKGTNPLTPLGKYPWAADRYPEIAPPVLAHDPNKKKDFLQKSLSTEALDFQKSRSAVQKDIEAGNYTPYFPPEKRFDADVSKYPARVETADVRMAQEGTRAKYDAIANNPAAVKGLNDAYDRGMLQVKDSGNWYQMGQLEAEYIKEYGPKAGRLAFKERFADAMSATTGGADPTSNFLMAHYGNYLKAGGNSIPANSYEYPFPIGGRYAGGNMKQFDKMVMKDQGVTPENPKRYNFSRNFLGDTKGATIDEQMSGLFDPKMTVPPPGTYGHFENALSTIARERGVDPRFFQEVGWAGAKDMKEQARGKAGYNATPMITNINESIERTSRLTGLSPAEVVKRMVRGEIPMYGIAGAAAGTAAAAEATRDQNATTQGDY